MVDIKNLKTLKPFFFTFSLIIIYVITEHSWELSYKEQPQTLYYELIKVKNKYTEAVYINRREILNTTKTGKLKY